MNTKLLYIITAERESETERRDASAIKARKETEFSNRLYVLLLNYQNCKMRVDKLAKVGELDAELSTLYDLIWNAALNPQPRERKKKAK